MTPNDVTQAAAAANPSTKRTPRLYTLRHIVGDAETGDSSQTFSEAHELANLLARQLIEGEDAVQEITTTTFKWTRTAVLKVGDDEPAVSEWKQSAI